MPLLLLQSLVLQYSFAGIHVCFALCCRRLIVVSVRQSFHGHLKRLVAGGSGRSGERQIGTLGGIVNTT